MRAGPRRAGGGRQRVARGHLLGGVPRDRRRPRRDVEAVPAVLLPRRHPEPRRPGDTRLHPRGRRARLRALARLRRRDGQPRPRRDRGGRRRRVRDRPAGRELARQQVRRPGQRRRGAADPGPQRLEDRQPDHPRPDPARGAREPAARLRPPRDHRRGRRPHRRAPPDGRGARRGPRHDPRDLARGPRGRRPRAPAVADDPARHAEGVDRSGGGRRQAGRGHVAGPPGAAGRHAGQRRAPRAARGVAALVRPRRALRRRRPTGGGGAPAGAGGHPADERQPARQRRPAQAAAAPARLAGERRRGGASGRVHPRADPRAGPVARRRGPRQRHQLPHLRARRDRVQPARRRLRGDRQGLGGRARTTSTSTSPGPVGWWRSSPSTPARAGSRATC